MKKISITDIGDFKLGNAENSEKGTGCTVIICEEGAVGGVDVRGGGPATRETDLLRSENTVNAVNAVVLSGGSAFGLEAASGVMRELADMKIGFDVGDDIVVPIVCGAALYDLPVGEKAFPDIYMGAQAVRNAFAGSFARGNHGAGTGATVGKLKGYDRAMKTGLGTFACGDGVIEVGAIAAVNAVGDIYNGAGNIIAGLRSEDGESIYGTIKTLKSMVHDKISQTEESVSFVNKSDLKEALAAAAKQFEEESHTEKPVQEVAAEELPAEPEIVAEEPAAEPVAEFVFQAPVEEPAAEFSGKESADVTEEPAEQAEETAESIEEQTETFEEPAAEAAEPETVIQEEPQEELSETPEDELQAENVSEPAPAAEVFEEPAEEAAEAPEEEFIPKTPYVNTAAENYREYAEISIPVEETSEVQAEETSEVPEEEIFAEPEEEAFVESAEEISEEAEEPEEPAEAFEEPQEEFVPEAEPETESVSEPAPVEEVFEIPAEEAPEAPEEAVFTEPEEEFSVESAEEISEEAEEPVETFEEPQAHEEYVPEEEPETESVSEPAPAEEVFEATAEEAPEAPEEELPEEPVEEVPDFLKEAEEEEEEIEEPVVLTREDMGYDIVFNTTISCLITNAALTKSQANKLASILHDAYARAIKPVHGTLDGDTVFVLATGKQKVNFDAFAALATDVLQYAIIDGAMSAESAYGLPSARDMR